MCEPTTLVLTALAITSTIVSTMETREQAKAAQKSLNAESANQALAIEEQQEQISKKATDEMQDRSQQATIERGRLRAIQAESGLLGNTQDRIVGESYFNESTDIASIEANRKAEITQSNRNLQGLGASTQSKLNSIKQPNYLGAGLQIGAQAATGYQQAQKNKTTK
ncbi:MAG: virion core protein, T7 gp14 family [Methylophilus sp.]|uniref:virion core protein, T7 gp14 family n=1 Tax=Methylophilus sp. TaxID=29541 RepID=UPI003F9F0498